MQVSTRLVIYLRSNSAKSGPPLGTTLGNIGVNTVKFCKEFNDFTKDLPTYFLLKVTIIISENKSFSFEVTQPSTGFLFSMLKQQETTKDINGNTITNNYVNLEDFLKLCKFKFPNYDLRKSSKILRGSLFSASILIR